MKSETKTIARTITKEDLALMKDVKGFYDDIIKNITRRLCDEMMGELEKGEKIVELSDFRVSEMLTMNMVDCRKYIRFTELIRCKDCKHRNAEDGFCEGRGWPMQLVPDDGFCDKGERSEDAND